MTAQTPGTTTEARASSRGLAMFLDLVERAGNRLPDQVTIFVVLAILVLIVSWICASAGVSMAHPTQRDANGAPKLIEAYDLLSREGLQWVFTNAVANFTGFAPLGVVLAALVGIGVADRSGLFTACLKALVISVPSWALTPTIVLAGILSHLASDAGYIILPPLAAALFVTFGRHPLAGISAAFAGVAGGFSANPLLSSLDPLLSGLTESGARLLDPAYSVNPACNWYFMASSTLVLVLAGWFVTAFIVEPRFGKWTGSALSGADAQGANGMDMQISALEHRGLIAALVAVLFTCGLLALLVVPESGVLRNLAGDAVGIRKIDPFLRSLVPLLIVFFLIPGLAYGIATGVIRSDADVARMMSSTMATMGHYIVLAFFAGQFIAWFNKSNLGFILALEGANFLKSIHLTGLGLMVGFVLATALLNIIISSASAKWTLLAPIFVPMLMALGKSPESTQAFYRIGDSVTNIITPLNVYFPILLAACHRYVPSAGIGTLIAAMLPYSIVFLVVWTAILTLWVLAGWPLGPDSPLYYSPAISPQTAG